MRTLPIRTSVSYADADKSFREEDVLGRLCSRSSGELGEIEESEQEILVDFDRHFLKQDRSVFEVSDTVGYYQRVNV